ncbi:MAG: dihydropteroate synthase [Alphaproteobacteria bacterium]
MNTKNFYNALKKTKKPLIQGILNLTPDSFYGESRLSETAFEKTAQDMIAVGADILDIGAESSRPGATPLSVEAEKTRLAPAFAALKGTSVPLSIDTYKPEIARYALENGATIINDITGLQNPAMIEVAAQFEAPVILMHMQGTPQNMQKSPAYKDIIAEICAFFEVQCAKAEAAGIKQIILDPGIGFGKTLEHNLIILQNLQAFKALGYPVLVGVSRKSMIGALCGNVPPEERLEGTLAAHIFAVLKGADIIRAHDVGAHKKALDVIAALSL